VIASTVAFRRL